MEEVEPKATILVVDDNAQNRALAESTLEDEGYRVLIATGGEEALALIEREPPDCVLLDVNMPGMNGLVTCERIRALPSGAGIPIVFLTALRDLDTFDEALRVGGDDFLTKPIHPTVLALRVQAALKLGRMSGELREVYERVRRQRDELIRLQLQKERLTSFVVHDLKNPVNAIDLHAQLLMRNRELPEAARRSVQQIRNEVRSLMRLILNLLDIGKGEEGRLSPQLAELDVQELSSQVMDALQARAENANVVLLSEISLDRAYADTDLLRRILENLLDNAIRHAPSGSEVKLVVRKEDEHVDIRVTDAGPGVPADLREKIFERFVQAERDASSGRVGHGLGLAFCKLAVEAHGGRIWLETSSFGATFCIRLPARDKGEAVSP